MNVKNNFIEELKWRGMCHDLIPGTEDLLNEQTIGYIGFDPTSDSLGIGNLVQIMTLLHFQQSGHKPIALIGGATGMVGDPSGKSSERKFLDEERLRFNQEKIKKQLEKFLNFNCGSNSAEVVNNYDWFKNVSFFDFVRNTGKYITINSMISKDSVQNRLENGMSFTEFTYQLMQGFDFHYLWKNKNVKLQMGGSDQWGNIVTGIELIRKKEDGKAFAIITPLIKKTDGTKFGKSENGNIWLGKDKTTPFQFYQFWLNSSDDDVKKYIRIFTLFCREQINSLEEEHNKSPNLRILQKALAKDITCRVHSEEDCKNAIEISEILFEDKTNKLTNISNEQLILLAENVQKKTILKSDLNDGIKLIEFLSNETKICSSKSESKKLIHSKGIAINKIIIGDVDFSVTKNDLINEKYIFVQKGKKNHFLVEVVDSFSAVEADN